MFNASRKAITEMTRSKEFEWITSKAAAKLAHIDERHVRRLGDEGKIKMIKLSPRVKLFLKSDVERWQPVKRGPKPKREMTGTTPGM